MDSSTVKRCRKPYWTQAEVDVLRNSYLEFRGIIDGRLGMSLTNVKKEQTWRDIQERINCQGTQVRTVEEVKKKLSDLKSSIKKRERERRHQSSMTGGGPAPYLNEWDEKMIEAIGEVAVGGFCGVDTFIESIETELESTLTSDESKCLDTSYERSCSRTADSNAPQWQNDKKRTENKKNTDDHTEKVLNLLEDQTVTLKQILEEQKKTNKILSQLFAVNVEP